MPRLPALISLLLVVMAPGAAGFAAEKSNTATEPAKSPKLSASARRGLAFAETRCAACHGIPRNSGSPNPEAPPFEDIVNKPGLTRATLHAFLRDSHNYPQAMNFTIDGHQIGDLAAYMVTLKRRHFRPAI
jgi:mono/diheme cytochrome c family protein